LHLLTVQEPFVHAVVAALAMVAVQLVVVLLLVAAQAVFEFATHCVLAELR
jgi:hypothetical protein